MKNTILLLAGVSLGLAYILIARQAPMGPAEATEELAHKLQDAWADHHTVA